MAEYIEREEMLSDFSDCNKSSTKWTVQRVSALIYRQPAADVAPVVHGRWRFCGADRWNDCYECSQCGRAAMENSDFCPNCGARMDGGVGNGEMGLTDDRGVVFGG